jgi:hypothetical protein
MADRLRETENQTIRTAAYGAVVLVSIAYPGMVSTARANVVGAKILTGATGVVGEILSAKGDPKVNGRSTAEIADKTFAALARAVEILSAKVPDEVEDFRRIVTIAVEQAAEATGGGATPAEREMISKIKRALRAEPR